MGRIYVYHCDCCNKDFEDNAHINVASIQVAIAHKTTKWKRKWVDYPHEYHFCNTTCMMKFFDLKITDGLTNYTPFRRCPTE